MKKKSDSNAVLPEALSNTVLENAQRLGVITFREEPEYSLHVLRQLEDSYGVSTNDVVMGLAVLDPAVATKWRFHWRMFQGSEGDPNELRRHSFAENRWADKQGAERHSALTI